ncbi:uncharacterized protein LOC134507018 isoform X1 [Candoia aspera]|uniref:uncharacterized protein LOC134507018 isoform X1 n=1 Tax=Candoia aspera TaxID=51853 RepID=UPI002FD82C36
MEGRPPVAMKRHGDVSSVLWDEALQRAHTSLGGQLRQLEEQNRQFLKENGEMKEGVSRRRRAAKNRQEDGPGTPPLGARGWLGAPTGGLQDGKDRHAQPPTSGVGGSRERGICVASTHSESCLGTGRLPASVASPRKRGCQTLRSKVQRTPFLEHLPPVSHRCEQTACRQMGGGARLECELNCYG